MIGGKASTLPLMLAGGVAIWLGFPNDFAEIPFLVLGWPLALCLLGLAQKSPFAAFRAGWLGSFAGEAAALYWLAMPVHDVGGLPWPLAIPCALFIAACLASAGGVFCWLCHVLRKADARILPLVLALSWYVLETAYAHVLGFPWLGLTGALAAWPVLVQGAGIIGAYALGGAWVYVTLALALGIGQMRQGNGAARVFWRILPATVLGAMLLLHGAWRMEAGADKADAQDRLSVLFVEGNVDQNQKWLPVFQRQTVELYRSLTHAGMDKLSRTADGLPPLVIWPETAMPFFLENNAILAGLVRQTAREAESLLLFGAPAMERPAGSNEGKVFNRAWLFGPDGATIGHYDKEHLVPFGEYLPSWLDWKFLEALLQGVGVYEQGTARAPIGYGRLRMGMLICYEGIFPWLAQQRVRDGANLLVDISNDGWFGNSPAPRQHLYLTALRAIEQNRWILRGTNTGISASIDPQGRLFFRGGQFQATSLATSALLLTEPSPYHHLAPYIFPLAATLLACLLFVLFRRKVSETC